GLEDLVLIGHEVLAQDRDPDLAAGQRQVLGRAAEAAALREHGECRRAGGGVGLGEVGGAVGPLDQPAAAGRLRFQLRDHGEDGRAQCRREIARGRGRPGLALDGRLGRPCLAFGHLDTRLLDDLVEDGSGTQTATAWETFTHLSSTSPARPESSASAASPIPSLKSFASPAARSAAAELSRTTSRRGPWAPASTSRAMAAFSAGPSPRIAPSGASGRPSSAGSRMYSRRSPPSTSITREGPVVVSSSIPSAPWKTSACSTPSRTRTSAIRPARAASATPSAWRRAPAGLQSGPRTLKTVRTPSSRRGTAAKRKPPW